MSSPNPDILQGWKDIAAYVSRDVSTVKRWEKYRGLPVHRMPGEGRANVYAHVSELDLWLTSAEAHSAGLEPEPSSNGNGSDLPLYESTAAAISSTPPTPPAVLEARGLRRWLWGLALVLIFCATAGFVVARRQERAKASIAARVSHPAVAVASPLVSAVPGVEDLYLRGVYSYELRTPDSLARAERYMDDAIAKDPTYAPAYAGLAITYLLMREYGSMPQPEAYAKARFTAEKAIQLNPKLSIPYVALGFIDFFWDWKAAPAEQEFRTAIALDPNSSLAHHWYGSMLTHEARFTPAVAQLDIAQRLAPDSTAVLMSRALALAYAGHREQAVDLLSQVKENDPDFPSVYARLGTVALIPPSSLPRFFAAQELRAKLQGDTAELAVNRKMEHAYSAQGEHAAWEVFLHEEQSKHPTVPTADMAAAQAELGNNDAAFAILDTLAQHHTTELIGINLTPEFDSLHHDPRYGQLLATMGLPPLQP